MSTTFELLHCTKNQMLALLPLLCFAMMFLIIGYSINDCTSRVKYEPKRITASIASNHLGEVRVHKPFAYYVLTEKCLPPFLLEQIALGDEKRCDVYVNSYVEKCDDKRTPRHIEYLYKPKTSWTRGRNLLYEYVKSHNKQYFYHIFMDDDVTPIYTEHIMEFAKTFKHREGDKVLYTDYLKSEKGFKDAIYMEKEQKSAWRTFEDELLINSPAFAITNYIRMPDAFESRLTMHKNWKEVCGVNKEMPWIVPTLYFDELFIAFHREALPILLPYTTMFDHINWQLSGVINVFRARALLYKYGMANYKISVINNKHRNYPRGKIPRDLIPQYLEADGVHLKDLIDERDRDYDKFGTWQQWENAFMHQKDLCTGPIKFPIWRHYRH